MDYGSGNSRYGAGSGIGGAARGGARLGRSRPPLGRKVDVAARPVRVLTAAAGVAGDQPHEQMVVVGLGDSFTEAEFLAFTVSDARRLRDLLDEATR